MADPREEKLAKLLVEYSVKLQKGESCLINAVDVPTSMTEALIKAVYDAGGYPVVNLWNQRIERAMVEHASKESLQAWADVDTYRMKQMDAFIGIRGIANVRELATIPAQTNLASTYYNIPVHMKTRLPLYQVGSTSPSHRDYGDAGWYGNEGVRGVLLQGLYRG